MGDVMKLYKFTGEYTHPQSGFGNAPIWHGSKDNVTFASMDDACLAVFNDAQEGNWSEGDAEDIAWCKANSPRAQMIRGTITKAIRAKYTVDQELQANRLRDDTVLNDIAAIVEAKKQEINAIFGG
jgi:hypothetical protein